MMQGITMQGITMHGTVLKGLDDRVAAKCWRGWRVARPELKHPVLFLRCNRPLGLHCFPLQNLRLVCNTIAAPPHRKCCHTSNAYKELNFESVMEPAVVDPDLPVLRGVEHVGITVTETDFVVLIGFMRVDRLRCNNVVA